MLSGKMGARLGGLGGGAERREGRGLSCHGAGLRERCVKCVCVEEVGVSRSQLGRKVRCLMLTGAQSGGGGKRMRQREMLVKVGGGHVTPPSARH